MHTLTAYTQAHTRAHAHARTHTLARLHTTRSRAAPAVPALSRRRAQVLELKAKADAIEKREGERRALDEKKHAGMRGSRPRRTAPHAHVTPA
jgi:hypothetical protein